MRDYLENKQNNLIVGFIGFLEFIKPIALYLVIGYIVSIILL